MKTQLIAIIVTFLFSSCKTNTSQKTSGSEADVTNKVSSEITFQVKAVEKEDLEIFEDGIIPWISIKKPELEIKNLIGKNDIVLKTAKASLVIDYPLEKPVLIEIKSANASGFTRKELVEIISKVYHRIYQEEEDSAQTKTVPISERQGLINRNKTDGKYGIWGHDIDDLDLSSIVVKEKENGRIELELFIES
ncbi:hypothetical protein [Maribacter algarum]|uniref:hypothetical protein n=1 Tax=Maribacter algarum (ex Zhang et al. 2020) TaxID=2578118 RepID=UPI0014861310|nr:hypothetical protein [Maribacter algarum]